MADARRKLIRPPDAAENDVAVLPVPANAPPPDLGKPTATREYRDELGQLLFYQVRYLKTDTTGRLLLNPNGKPEKMDRYRVLRRTAKGTLYWDFGWACIPKPRPLYRGEFLPMNPSLPVIVCEGEKAAEAAASLFPNHVSVSWMGGSDSAKHADWGKLAGRHVLIFRDHDEPGLKAAKAVMQALQHAAASVSLLNLETLSQHLGHPLKRGFDADDLKSEEGWTAEQADRFLSDKAATSPATTAMVEADPGATHRRLLESLENWLRTESIMINAVEQWSDNDYRPMPRTSVMTIAGDFAYHYRYMAPISTDLVRETLTTIARRKAADRRNWITLRLIGHDAEAVGMRDLVRFVNALTGTDDTTALHALRHWLWLIKRTLADKPRAFDLMPVLFGKQRSGKSTAVARLCQPLAELATPIQSNVLTDERSAPILGRFYAGIWDELEGINRAEIEAIKNAITCITKMHRVLGAHDSGTVVRTMNFIGTSNKPIGQVMRDTTGLGRFAEITCLDRVDWKAINEIDYERLWRCVSENDPPPLEVIASDLAEEQEESRHRDTVCFWLEQETWERLVWEPTIGGGTVTIPDFDRVRGETAEEIRSRYVHWCRSNGEAVCPSNTFWQRLKEEGFSSYRPHKAARRYRRSSPNAVEAGE